MDDGVMRDYNVRSARRPERIRELKFGGEIRIPLRTNEAPRNDAGAARATTIIATIVPDKINETRCWLYDLEHDEMNENACAKRRFLRQYPRENYDVSSTTANRTNAQRDSRDVRPKRVG